MEWTNQQQSEQPKRPHSNYYLNFKKRYNFHDISVYYKQKNGLYIDLTEFEITARNEEKHLPSEAKYVISFLNTRAENRKCISEISLEEMLILANQKSERFTKQLKQCDSMEGENFLALYCAKKIVNYKCGRIRLIEEESTEKEGIYVFARHDGHNNYPEVLTKTFRRI